MNAWIVAAIVIGAVLLYLLIGGAVLGLSIRRWNIGYYRRHDLWEGAQVFVVPFWPIFAIGFLVILVKEWCSGTKTDFG